MNHEVRVPIGIDDFRKVRDGGLTYVDKTHLVTEVLDKAGVEVLLLPRPRRFGKTLNLSMLRYFFEKRPEDMSPLFQGLHAFEAGDAYRAHFQRYPVIFLTFKGTRHPTFEGCWTAIREKIQTVFDEHRELLESGCLSEHETSKYLAVIDGTASRAVYERSLLDLSSYLHRRDGERVVLLLDEYDEPIHAGYLNGYADEILPFCRMLLTEGLKGNVHLFKAVLTGILRVARESIFSGLNNPGVYSLLRSEFNTCFGFTEAEVDMLLEQAGLSDRRRAVRVWYDGYVFGGRVIYNPWSVLNLLASEDKRARPYWVATSSNDLIKELLEHHAAVIQEDMATLLAGGTIERDLDEHVALSDLRARPDALFSLLVFSGYLRAEETPDYPEDEGEPPYRLSIPNREVRQVYTATFSQWLEARLLRQGGSVDRLERSLLGGDAEGFEQQLQAFVTDTLSYHDPGGNKPERVYQAFLIGLLAVLAPSYQVRSNRESGHGRPDVLIRPTRADRPGVVLELKVARPPEVTLEDALEEGLAQIRQNDYAAELRAAGASPVHGFAVAFDGKRVRVRSAAEPPRAQRASKRATKKEAAPAPRRRR